MQRLALRLPALLLLTALRAGAQPPAPCLPYDRLDLGNGFSLDLPATVCAERHLFSNTETFDLRAKARPGSHLLDLYAYRPTPRPWLPKNPQADEIVLAETRTVLPFTLEFAGESCQPILHRGIPEGGKRPEARLDAFVSCEREDGRRTTTLLHFWYNDLAPEAQKTAEAILATLRATPKSDSERTSAE